MVVYTSVGVIVIDGIVSSLTLMPYSPPPPGVLDRVVGMVGLPLVYLLGVLEFVQMLVFPSRINHSWCSLIVSVSCVSVW